MAICTACQAIGNKGPTSGKLVGAERGSSSALWFQSCCDHRGTVLPASDHPGANIWSDSETWPRSTHNRLDTNSKSRPWIENYTTLPATVWLPLPLETLIFGNRKNLVRELARTKNMWLNSRGTVSSTNLKGRGAEKNNIWVIQLRLETVGVRWGWSGSRKKTRRWNAALELQRRVTLV